MLAGKEFNSFLIMALSVYIFHGFRVFIIFQKNDENEELMAMLMLARDTQNELASEIVEVKKQYEEVLTMLHECQTELKGYRDKHIPLARAGPLFTSLPPYLNSNGLHSHGHSSLESSLFSELSLDSGICTGRM